MKAIWIVAMLFVIPSVFGMEYCYQESVNFNIDTIGQSCGARGGGSYSDLSGWSNSGYAVDGDWMTYAANGGADTANVILTYYYPLNSSLVGARWNVKSDAGAGGVNNSIQIPSSCFNAYPDRIVFNVSSDIHGGIPYYYVNFSCYNTSQQWTRLLTTGQAGANGLRFYEDGVNWTFEPSFFTNCSSTNTSAFINFSFFDEDSPSSSVYVDANFFLTLPETYYNYSWSGKNINSVLFCENVNFNYNNSYDLYVLFNASGGSTNRHYVFNRSIGATTFQQKLYATSQLHTPLAALLYKESTGALFPGVHAVLQRWNVGEWFTAQEYLTGESGEADFRVVEESVDYRFAFFDQHNNLLKQTGTLSFLCPSGVCSLGFIIPDEGVEVEENDATLSYYFNNATRNIQLNYSHTENASFNMLTRLFSNNELLCNLSASNSSGSFSCNIIKNGTFVSTMTQDGRPIGTFTSWTARIYLEDLLGIGLASFIFFFFALTVIFGFSAMMPGIGSIIGTILVLIAASVMNLLSFLTFGIIIGLMVAGIIIGTRLRYGRL